VDIAPTVLHILGAPIPADMDGKVLKELLSPSGPAAGPVRREPIDWDQDPWALDHAPAAHDAPSPESRKPQELSPR
jgi:hypothetical protein